MYGIVGVLSVRIYWGRIFRWEGGRGCLKFFFFVNVYIDGVNGDKVKKL